MNSQSGRVACISVLSQQGQRCNFASGADLEKLTLSACAVRTSCHARPTTAQRAVFCPSIRLCTHLVLLLHVGDCVNACHLVNEVMLVQCGVHPSCLYGLDTSDRLQRCKAGNKSEDLAHDCSVLEQSDGSPNVGVLIEQARHMWPQQSGQCSTMLWAVPQHSWQHHIWRRC